MQTRHHPHHRNLRTSDEGRRRGFTLIEAVVSLAIIGLVLLAALTTLGATVRMRHVGLASNLGSRLANDLMREVISTHYVDPDPNARWGIEDDETTTSRLDWDDVDDYDGWSSSPPRSRDGVPIPNADGWTRSVSAWHVPPNDPGAIAGGRTGIVRISVIVTSPTGETTQLNALRAQAGAHEQPPPVDATYVTWVGVELLLENSTESAKAGVNLLNHVVGSS